ncbi:MAG: hypothetical protein ACK6DA_08450 [Candidatus Kapaibacterium sp.]|jgi:hypothetical protein
MTDKLASEILRNVYKGGTLADILNKIGASEKEVLLVLNKTKINLDALLVKDEPKTNSKVEEWDAQSRNLKIEAVQKLIEKGYNEVVAANLVEKGYENFIIDENTSSDMIVNAALLKARKNDLISVKPGIAVMNQAASQLVDAQKKNISNKSVKDDGIYKI